MKAALEQVTKLWQAGYVHPDSFTNPGENFTWWSGGTPSIYFQSIGWPKYAKSYTGWDIGVITLPKWDGGGLAPKALHAEWHLLYCGSREYVNLYVPGNSAVVKAEHDYLATVMPTGVSNPTWGLYSETAATKGATAGTNVLNAQSDIIQGRRKLSEWDQIVKTWRQQASDAMRKEYEKAYADLHSGH
jgi:hypothetical protein